MNDTTFWDARRGIIRTRKGGWVIGEAIYNQGYSMMDDLVGKASFFQVLTLNATGRMVERPLADWMEAVFVCMSWPDARIWCNQIGSLAGTMQASSVAGVSAGMLDTDSFMYGVGPLIEGTRFIIDALTKKKNGMSVKEIIAEHCRRPGSKPQIVGYARPIVTGDERVTAMERVTEELGFEIGEHLALAYEIAELMWRNYTETMNINGYATAFLADHGFSVRDIYRIGTTCVVSGVQACYAEAADSPPESFFPLRCDDVDYQGKPPRPVPDKK